MAWGTRGQHVASSAKDGYLPALAAPHLPLLPSPVQTLTHTHSQTLHHMHTYSCTNIPLYMHTQSHTNTHAEDPSFRHTQKEPAVRPLAMLFLCSVPGHTLFPLPGTPFLSMGQSPASHPSFQTQHETQQPTQLRVLGTGSAQEANLGAASMGTLPGQPLPPPQTAASLVTPLQRCPG